MKGCLSRGKLIFLWYLTTRKKDLYYSMVKKKEKKGKLDKAQKDFIKNKVRLLGSVERVHEFYKRKSLVCEYAHKIAKKLFGGKNV